MLRSSSFVFDGIPSEDYGIMIYFLDDDDTRELELGTDVDVIEDRLPKRITPIHYGVDINKSMSFPLTFGSVEYLSDYDVDAILSWLTGHNQYKWLEYVDGDHYVRYKCHLNNMQSVYINGLPVAFTCDVECDSQFAYEYETKYIYDINENELEIDFLNKSSYNGYLYPTVELQLGNDCNGISIVNDTDGGREFKIDSFPRVSVTSGNSEYIYDTKIATEAVNDTEETDGLITWQARTLPVSDSFSDVIIGNGVWVLLPSNGSTALYSQDEGETWNKTSLPYSGAWTGCYGEKGFVAICTDDDTAIASYSQTGMVWNINPIELPVSQRWNSVTYVETEGFVPNQYIAVGGPDSSIAAISASGWAWEIVTLPTAQDWKSVFGSSGKIFAVGGNSNVMASSNDCVDWELVSLPKYAAWTDGCYGINGFVVVADTLYGSSSKESIALHSANGKEWEVSALPVGSWSSVIYSSSGYVAIGERQFATSIDGINWSTNTLPISVSNIIPSDTALICVTGGNKYLISDSSSTISGNFTVSIQGDENESISNVFIYATLSNTLGDATYVSNGEKLLASNAVSESTGNIEETGGESIALTTDLRYGLDMDGVMAAATYDASTNTATIYYVADVNHISVINADLTIRIEYQSDASTDLGYDGLEVKIDNQNQIITTNKETLNMYEYFNMRFFRLVKGFNKLRLKTTGGTCKVILTCEFLRKVGGR